MTAGSTANSRSKCAIPSWNEVSVSKFARSPTWWPTQARLPFARQKVFFSSAPHASTCRPAATGRAMLSGTWPRERRSISVRRAPRNGRDAQHRVVRPRLDRAVVHEEAIRDRGQPGRAPRRRGRRSARRTRSRSSSPAGRRRRRAAGGEAASTAASRPARARRERRTARRPRPRAGVRSRSAAPAPPAAPARPRPAPPAPARPRGRGPSGRTACPRGACARAGWPRRARCRRGRRGGNRRCP